VGLLILGGFLIQFAVQGAWGIIPAHISELSPDAVRGFLPGFSYQMGALISAFLPWIQDRFKPAGEHGYGSIMAVSALIVFCVAILVVASGREKHGIRFGGDGTTGGSGSRADSATASVR
jgi:SHS family lactate transporter-like MFS transporter